MPIPFRDSSNVDQLGAAGFLKIDSSADGSIVRGALFLINARGEPLEFTYNRVETPNSFLWPRGEIKRHATRKLVTSLLTVCPKVPRFLLCLADEVPHELFCNEINLSVPVCRVTSPTKTIPYSTQETQEIVIEGPEPFHLFWFPGKPPDESDDHRLIYRLVTNGLLLEPFDRALIGLREVYPLAQDNAPNNQKKA